MVDQKLTVSQFQVGAMRMWVADPCLLKITAAMVTSSAPSTHVAHAPAFSVHLPIFMPIRLVPSAIQMATSDTPSRNTRLSASQAWDGPSA